MDDIGSRNCCRTNAKEIMVTAIVVINIFTLVIIVALVLRLLLWKALHLLPRHCGNHCKCLFWRQLGEYQRCAGLVFVAVIFRVSRILQGQGRNGES